MADPHAVRLFGRKHEERLLYDLLDNVQARGGELLLRGEAGVGKSSLLQASAAYAQQHGFRILRSAGIQSEANLPFAGLHQLLRPVQSGIDALPEPQRQALLSAFGMSDDLPPDLFLIALATLNLLADVASDSPLLVIADDAQFIDGPTCDVLVFIARRLESDPIVLLSAIRDGYETALGQARLRELPLEPLNEDAARAVLNARAPDLPDQQRQLLLSQAAGNPLALVELPLESLARSKESPGVVLPLSGKLEEAFSSRIHQLPEATRTLLLVAVTNDSGSIVEIAQAASQLDPAVSSDDFWPAVSSRLVVIDGPELRFRHPLVRSGIYQATRAEERRAAHAALAAAIVNEPDRVAWHLAASTLGTDGRVAAEMEAAAQRALKRGAVTVAVAAMAQSAELAEGPASRNRNMVRAARLAAEVAPRKEVLQLLARVEAAHLEGSVLGEFEYTRERVSAVPYTDRDRPRYLADLALTALHDDNPDLALDLLAQAGSRCYFSDAEPETNAFVCGVAERMETVKGDPRLTAAFIYADASGRGSEVRDTIIQTVLGTRPPEVELYLCQAAVFYGGCVEASNMLPSVINRLRADGRLLSLTSALMYQSWVALHLMDLVRARAAVDEGLRLTSNYPSYAVALRCGELMGAALRGDQEAVERLMTDLSPDLNLAGLSPLAPLAQLATGVALLSQLRFADAYKQLKRLFDPADRLFASRGLTRMLGVAYFADAANHSEHRREAEAMLRDTSDMAGRLPAPLLHQHLSVAMALLADENEAEPNFRQALATEGPSSFLRANVQLAYGAWLRRQRRIIESRELLRLARETFDQLGAVPWEERARRELAASGEASRRRSVSAMDQLTPQELQIAQMVAAGLSNREIAQQLFLSPRTVGSHLYRVFPKLNITSRAQVAGALERKAE